MENVLLVEIIELIKSFQKNGNFNNRNECLTNFDKT